jgi:hypothetical protein
MKRLLGIAAVLFPALLLLSATRGFYIDWNNHVWLAGYCGEFARQHGHMPLVMNTPEFTGMTFPIFYGYLLYPLLGLTSIWLNPELGVRLAAILLLALEYVSVRKTVKRLGAAEGLASAGACLTIWATYALTNLYNRSALTEFFAVGLLTCAICYWFDLLSSPNRSAAWRRALRFGLAFALAAGSHPITAMLALPVLGLLALALVLHRGTPGRRALLGPVAAAAALGVVVLAPWVQVVREFQNDLWIVGVSGDVVVFGDSIDHWQTRLFPLPHDSRLLNRSLSDVSTPYLDAQINLPLLILCGALVHLAWKQRQWRGQALAALPLAYGGLCLYLSLSATPYRFLPDVFHHVQFAYRQVTYVNLAILLALFYFLKARSVSPASPEARLMVSPTLLCFVLTLSAAGVAVKLTHATCGRLPSLFPMEVGAQAGSLRALHPTKTAEDRRRLTHLPSTFYNPQGYTMPRCYSALSAVERARARSFPLEVECEEGRFGDCHAVVAMDTPGYALLPVGAFAWNEFLVDGEPVAREELRCIPSGWIPTAVPVPAGTHTITYRLAPPPAWLWLRRLATGVLICWSVSLVCLGYLKRRRSPVARIMPQPQDVFFQSAA